jgi:hypothetical protein
MSLQRLLSLPTDMAVDNPFSMASRPYVNGLLAPYNAMSQPYRQKIALAAK